MLDDSFYDYMDKRRSIRSFNETFIDLEDIENIIQNAERLDNSIDVEFRIVKADVINRNFMRKAPYYIAAFSEKKGRYLENIGFILEQVDLFLSKNNIASCWQGIPQPKKELRELSDLDFIIFLAFGESNEPIHRNNLNEFNRKNLNKISDVKSLNNIMKMVNLAPSARNSQPWYFTGDEHNLKVYCKKPSVIDKTTRLPMFNRVDMGIVLLFLVLSLNHENKKYTINLDNKNSKSLKKYYPIANIIID